MQTTDRLTVNKYNLGVLLLLDLENWQIFMAFKDDSLVHETHYSI